MRAAKSILASLVLVFSSVPALALSPGWQRHAAPSEASAADGPTKFSSNEQFTVAFGAELQRT